MLLIEPNILRNQIDNYFAQVDAAGKFKVGEIEIKERNPTLTGLALFLGFSSLNHFKTYEERPEYTDIIQYAKLRIEQRYEQLLQEGKTTAKIGLNKVGQWDDTSKVEHGFTFADFVKRISDG